VPGDFAAHGIFGDTAKSSSAQFWATTHKAWLAAAGSLAGAGALLLRRVRRPK
jgi:hypothetical protein